AAEMIVHSTRSHFAQRDQIHFERVLPRFALGIARVKPRQKIQRDRARKFWGGAEAAFLVVERARQLFVGGLKKLIVDLSSGFRLCVLRFAKGLQEFGALVGNFCVVLFPSGRDSLQYFLKPRLAVSIYRRKISSANKRFQIRREPDTHRPTSAPSCCL